MGGGKITPMNYIETLKKVDINISTSGDNLVIPAPQGSNYLAIDFISLLPTTAVVIQFKDGTTPYGGPLPLDTKQALTWENAMHNEHGVLTLSPGNGFTINLGGNVQVGGIIRYREVGGN